jgi:hypothetical protein
MTDMTKAIGTGGASQVNELFKGRLAVGNVGLQVFAQACNDQQTPCVHVDWKPPAGGNKELADLLARLKDR